MSPVEGDTSRRIIKAMIISKDGYQKDKQPRKTRRLPRILKHNILAIMKQILQTNKDQKLRATRKNQEAPEMKKARISTSLMKEGLPNRKRLDHIMRSRSIPKKEDTIKTMEKTAITMNKLTADTTKTNGLTIEVLKEVDPEEVREDPEVEEEEDINPEVEPHIMEVMITITKEVKPKLRSLTYTMTPMKKIMTIRMEIIKIPLKSLLRLQVKVKN
jgi:hypothetical protein